jgi:hypothetical protein
MSNEFFSRGTRSVWKNRPKHSPSHFLSLNHEIVKPGADS